jgi:hypothetical protein
MARLEAGLRQQQQVRVRKLPRLSGYGAHAQVQSDSGYRKDKFKFLIVFKKYTRFQKYCLAVGYLIQFSLISGSALLALISVVIVCCSCCCCC